MVAARRHGEAGRHHEGLGARQGELAVLLGEAQVVTDGESHRPARELAQYELITRLVRSRFARFGAGDIDVEHMDLAVRRHAIAFGIEDERGVAGTHAGLGLLTDRATVQPHAMLLCPRGHRLRRLALERFGGGDHHLIGAGTVPAFG